MSYTKDSNGNIVRQKWWQKSKPVDLPPPLPPKEEKPQDDLKGLEADNNELLYAILGNQKALYDELQEVKKDISLIKDESVDEATMKFKALQEELVEQIAELEKKKGAKKK